MTTRTAIRTASGARAPGLSLPLTESDDGPSGPEFAANQASLAAVAGAALRALPGLDAWSLACRRKTLRGLWRGWLLKSRKPVR